MVMFSVPNPRMVLFLDCTEMVVVMVMFSVVMGCFLLPSSILMMV